MMNKYIPLKNLPNILPLKQKKEVLGVTEKHHFIVYKRKTTPLRGVLKRVK